VSSPGASSLARKADDDEDLELLGVSYDTRARLAMNDKRLVKTSKYLSRHLRHDPGRLGLTLEPGGWVPVDALLRACRSHSFALTIEDLREVVERNDKQRFSFDETGTQSLPSYARLCMAK
jgi:RNA:NAD 2'-phosphotransferase (TPT1/KptA family)